MSDETEHETLASLQVPNSIWQGLPKDVQADIARTVPTQRSINRVLSRVKRRRLLNGKAEAILQKAKFDQPISSTHDGSEG